MDTERKTQVSELKSALVQNYIEAKQGGYENKTLAERIDFVAKTMELTREYCCSLWNIDPNSISLGFDFPSLNLGIRNEKTNKVDSSRISYSFFGAMIHRPELVYKVCLHELRHSYQREHRFSPEAKSYYYNVPANSNTYHTAWQGSPNEIGADKFGFNTTIEIIKQASIQNPETVKPCEPEALSALAKTNHLTHLKAAPIAPFIGAFFNACTNTAWMLDIKNPTENSVKENTFLTIKEMQYLAKSNPDFFNQRFPVSLGKSDSDKYAHEKETIENFMHSVNYTNLREECANSTIPQTENFLEDLSIQTGTLTVEERQTGDLQTIQDNVNLQSNLETTNSPAQQEVLETNQSTAATQQTEVTTAPTTEACITLE